MGFARSNAWQYGYLLLLFLAAASEIFGSPSTLIPFSTIAQVPGGLPVPVLRQDRLWQQLLHAKSLLRLRGGCEEEISEDQALRELQEAGVDVNALEEMGVGEGQGCCGGAGEAGDDMENCVPKTKVGHGSYIGRGHENENTDKYPAEGEMEKEEYCGEEEGEDKDMEMPEDFKFPANHKPGHLTCTPSQLKEIDADLYYQLEYG